MSGHRRRLREVTETLSRHGLAFLVTDAAHPAWPPFHRGLLGHPRRSEPYTRADHLRLALEELGPTFVKVGQILSTRPDLLPPEYLTELSRLQDATPPVAAPEIVKTVTAELKGDLGLAFLEFDTSPLASASIGQVHAAILADGTEVVVKVRRPGVDDTIVEDLEILKDISARASRRWAALADYDLMGLVEEFSQTLLSELDYSQEGRNAERFASNFAGNNDVRIPRVYWIATSPRMLTLERVHGIKITDVDALDTAGIDRRALAVRATEIVCQMVFIDGFFHADPHPGNLFIEPDGRVALIDFGMVGEIGDKLREQLAAMLVAVAQEDTDLMVGAVVALDVNGTGIDRQALRADLDGLLTRYRGLSIGEIAIGPLIVGLLDILRSHHIAMPHQMILLLKMLVMVEGLGIQLDPGFQMGEVLSPFAERLVANQWSASKLARRYARLLADAIDLGAEIPELLRRLTVAAELRIRDEQRQGDDLHQAVREVEKASRDLGIGIVTAAAVASLVQWTVASRDRSARERIAISLVTVAAPVGAFVGWSLIRTRQRTGR